MNVKKVSFDKEQEVLRLYYNGVPLLKRISLIVGFSEPTISRIIDDSFENKRQYKEEFIIKESIINYD